jgi:hypothetical protein
MTGAISQLPEICYLVGPMTVKTLNLVPHAVCFSTSISMQQAEKIHFHKYMLREKLRHRFIRQFYLWV